MRRWLLIVGFVVVVALASWVWPLWGAVELARAAQSGDAEATFALVDVDTLRRSLSRQIARAYVGVSGKAEKLGVLGRSVVGAAATTVADPYVAELLTPANLMALLAKGRVNEVKLGDRTLAVASELPNLSKIISDDLLPTFTGSYYDGLNDFLVPLDNGHGANGRFVLHMRRVGLVWKLGGLDLPSAIVDEMARSIAAGNKAATQ